MGAREYRWTAQRALAALLVAHDERPNVAIAATVGIGRDTLLAWRKQPAFQARVAEYVAAFAEVGRRSALATTEGRMAALEQRWRGMLTLIEERARLMGPLGERVPGAATGLLTQRVKQLGRGEKAEVVEEYAFDAALVRALLEHEKQAARELGQWEKRQEADGPIEVVYVNDWRTRDDDPG